MNERTVRVSATVLALALLGDALLYVALPVDAARFGVTAGGVGLLLSANRMVRLVGYGAIADLAQRLGPRRLTLLAAVAATGSTLGYGVVRGVPAMLVLRVVWGLAFGALSLTTIVYAVGDPARAGQRMGASRAYIALGPLLALTLGPFVAGRWSSPMAFLVLGSLTALAIPLAAALPRDAMRGATGPRATQGTRWGFVARRSWLTWWSFGIGFTVDGVFAVSFGLVVARSMSATSAMTATALVIATRYLAEIVLSPLAGRLGDRQGVVRLLRRCTVLVAIGLVAMGIGVAGASASLWIGATVVVISRGLLLPLGPAVLATSADPYRAQGDLAAWRDAGAALGPLVAGWSAGVVPATVLYVVLAGVLLVSASFSARLRPSGRGAPDTIAPTPETIMTTNAPRTPQSSATGVPLARTQSPLIAPPAKVVATPVAARVNAAPAACCGATEQSTCCEPAAKSGCCGSEATSAGGCGCK